MFYLIDGYNLVLASGLARTLNGPGNYLRAQSRLLGWLAGSLTEIERSRTTVVFDAKPGTVDKKELIVDGMRVLFAVDYPDADSQLEDLIAKHSAPKQLTVVSSDRRIRTAATSRRAQALTSEDWYDQMERRKHQPPALAEPEEKPSVGNAEQLITEFDTAEIQRLIDDEPRDYP